MSSGYRGRGLRGGWGLRGGMSAGRRPVTEADRISIAERLEEFRVGDKREMTFEADLSNHDRAVVHDFCKRMGFKSKSRGTGEARCVTVQKPTGGHGKGQPSITTLSLSAEAQEAISELFTNFPPTDDELTGHEQVSQPFVCNASQKPGLSRNPHNTHPVKAAGIAKRLSLLGTRPQKAPALQEIVKARAKLPIAAFKDVITSAIAQNQVVLIAGETGCGKTTQVPQYILDHMWSQGKPCRILCTQPRRISATSVAERIAAELGEPVGDTVGYQIRLEAKGGKHSSLMFCTNGVLLRKLVGSGNHFVEQDQVGCSDDGLWDERAGINATHIIVDEIHERDRNADFLLIVLRDLLPRRPDLHLVLMSATLDADLFSSYFNQCPVVRVPGFTFPVRSFYLEDVLAITEYGTPGMNQQIRGLGGCSLKKEDEDAMEEAISMAWLDDDFELLMQLVSENSGLRLWDYKHPLTGATPLMVAAGKGRVDDVSLLLSLGADPMIRSNDEACAVNWAERHGHHDVVDLLTNYEVEKALSPEEAELIDKYHTLVDQEEIDVKLIERLLLNICSESNEKIDTNSSGAVLVFLPGWEDITRVRECLQDSPIFGNRSKFLLLPLHSMVPSSEQRKVFQRPAVGVRKIVLATNIAETAITIDDVVFVIDSGKMKEKSYDPYTNVSTLQTAWISKASAKQREGRAGRCQPGVCYHLFSKVRAASLPDFQLPEIKRTPLEELCLQVKLLEPNGNIAKFISKAVAPPLELAVRNAVVLLQDIGALTPDEKLTQLGKQLGSLPVHPSTSKMLLFAILFNCLDPALTIACATGYRDPFVLPMTPSEKKLAHSAKHELAAKYGGYSDHLAVIAAFDLWEVAKASGKENQFCSKYFVSGGTMAMLAGMRRQLQSELSQKGFVSREPHACSLNSKDAGILRAVLAVSMYPMMGILLPPLPGRQRAVVQTPNGEKVRIHPQSENFQFVGSNKSESSHDDPLVVFNEITRSESQVYIRNSTLVKPHALILTATEMVVTPLEQEEIGIALDDEEGALLDEADDDVKVRPNITEKRVECMSSPDKVLTVVMDRWLHLTATALEAAQLYCLRGRLTAAISHKIQHPRALLPPQLAASVFAIACVFSFDGSLDGDTASSSVARTPIPEETRLQGRAIDANISSSYKTVFSPHDRGKGRGTMVGMNSHGTYRGQQYVAVRDGRQNKSLEGPNKNSPGSSTL